MHINHLVLPPSYYRPDHPAQTIEGLSDHHRADICAGMGRVVHRSQTRRHAQHLDRRSIIVYSLAHADRQPKSLFSGFRRWRWSRRWQLRRHHIAGGFRKKTEYCHHCGRQTLSAQ